MEMTMWPAAETPRRERCRASFGQRLASWLVDWLFVTGVALLMGWAANQLERKAPVAPRSSDWRFAVFMLGLAAIFIYFPWLWSRGQTLGMTLASIRIVDRETGRRPRLGRMILRFVVSLVCVFGVLLAALLAGVMLFAGGLGINVGDAVARVLVIYAGLPLLIALGGVAGHLWMLGDAWGQTWADKAGHAVVVRAPCPAAPSREWDQRSFG